MNFVDFQLRAWVASAEQLHVLVHISPVGAMRQPLKVPFNFAEYKSICELIRKAWLSEPGLLPEIVTEAVLLPTANQATQVQSQQEEVRRNVSQMVSQRSLRLALMKEFDEAELQVLCSDIEEDLKREGVELEIDLEIAGGTTKGGKILNLIEYLERRDSLGCLVTVAQRERPSFSI